MAEEVRGLIHNVEIFDNPNELQLLRIDIGPTPDNTRTIQVSWRADPSTTGITNLLLIALVNHKEVTLNINEIGGSSVYSVLSARI